MKKIRYAFTMIELVFVIVILGILAAVAIPKLSGVTRDANLAQGMATVSSIRAAIAGERQRSLIQGNANYPLILDNGTVDATHTALFDGNSSYGNAGYIAMLQYPLYSKSESGGWMKITTVVGQTASYKFYVTASETEIFSYNSTDGKFDCNHDNTVCKEMTE